MNEKQALAKMYSPGMKRPGKRAPGGVIQVHITRACDKACFNCTQASNLRGPYTYMSLENFEKTCVSLQDYFGTVGVFGGNPALHPKFDEICAIMREHIPYARRGLWCNKLMGKGRHARVTFNPQVSNLNVHMDKAAYDEFKRDWPESLPFGLNGDSRHSPVYVAMQDVVHNEEKRWELISGCDVNQHWSAMVCEFRGEARGFFCEIAGSIAMLHQHEPDHPDLGVEIEPGWWRKTMTDFAPQVRKYCHECGVPLRGYGTLACAKDDEGKEFVSITHNNVYQLKRKARRVELVTMPKQLDSRDLEFHKYLQGANR